MDPEWLIGEFGEQPYQQLKVAMSKLDLQLWLREQELESAFPALVDEGYTSRNQLYTMDLEKVLQVECIDVYVIVHKGLTLYCN